MKKLYLLLLFLFAFQAQATHIVGGEFELLSVDSASYQYRITLNLYFDDVNGSPGAVDQSISYSIFEKNTNQRIFNDFLPISTTTFVPYTNQDCAIGSLRTKKIVYTKLITLSPSYNSPNGYYLAAERCCRNNTINNIDLPGATGQTFYLEFPAVQNSNGRFINSSPKLFPPLSDYACFNTFFYFDFSGDDPDGDSLVYEMVAPFKGHSLSANPAPLANPAPYPPVNWLSGLSATNQIPGNPTINIDRFSGQLQFIPTQTGLFVFGIKCEEYRNGIKIGEVRRDFQLLVINCPINDKPNIQVKQPGAAGFYNPQDTIRIMANDSNRCIDLYLSDPDQNERVFASVKPLNFSSNQLQLSNASGLINAGGNTDSLVASVCLPACFDSDGKVYQLQAIVKDDGCSLPKQDTVIISFIAEQVANQPPVITTTAPVSGYTADLGDIIRFQINGMDADNDQVSLSAAGQGFNLSSQNISFTSASGQGTATGNFSWTIDCNALQQDSFILNFTASSVYCGARKTQSQLVTVRINHRNLAPEFSTSLAVLNLDIPVHEPFSASFSGKDLDLDELELTAAGAGFKLEDYGLRFTNSSGKGEVESVLEWTPDCSALNKESFTVNLTLKEKACKPNPPETMQLQLRLIRPEIPEFLPANIFTPNNDGINDRFMMPNLPPDFCETVFSQIRVYNRWGSKVYESTDRNFAWDGKGISDGVYYYMIKYTNQTFKGTVTITR